MATTAQSIVLRAHTALFDPDGTRWPADELVRHLNDGQRALLEKRPDQKAQTAAVTLVSGFRHTLPTDALALVGVTHNATGRMRRITKTDVTQLDALLPDWRSAGAAAEIVHFMYDLREPRVFQTYPPANNAQVSMTYGLYPVDVPVPAGPMASHVTGSADVPDTWADALLNFVLFKAYSKDAEFGGNSQMAAGYLALFNAAVGSQLQSTATVAPQT